MGFKITKGRLLTPEPDESLRATSLSQVQRQSQLDQGNARVGKISRPGEPDQRDPDVPDLIALGRELKL
jgi:hypothetical protein